MHKKLLETVSPSQYAHTADVVASALANRVSVYIILVDSDEASFPSSSPSATAFPSRLSPPRYPGPRPCQLRA